MGPHGLRMPAQLGLTRKDSQDLNYHKRQLKHFTLNRYQIHRKEKMLKFYNQSIKR